MAQQEVVFARNGSLFGTVFDHDGVTPVQGAVVRVLGHPSLAGLEVLSDADGSFRFDLVPPANQIALAVGFSNGVVAREAWAWARYSQLGQQLEIDLVLSKVGSASGRVEARCGAPVPGATANGAS